MIFDVPHNKEIVHLYYTHRGRMRVFQMRVSQGAAYTFVTCPFHTVGVCRHDLALMRALAGKLIHTQWCQAFESYNGQVLFENRPALYFCNYIFITANKMYNFWFRIKDTVYFFLLSIIIIMILILKIFLHNVHKIINLRYPTYVYQFIIFLIITKIEGWPVFKQDPNGQPKTGFPFCVKNHNKSNGIITWGKIIELKKLQYQYINFVIIHANICRFFYFFIQDEWRWKVILHHPVIKWAREQDTLSTTKKIN